LNTSPEQNLLKSKKTGPQQHQPTISIHRQHGSRKRPTIPNASKKPGGDVPESSSSPPVKLMNVEKQKMAGPVENLPDLA